MARVLLTSEARRHFDLLPATFQDAVLEALTAIEVDPEGAGKPLLGRLKGLWSSRVGNYRILYTIEGGRRSPTVIVRAIRHRAVAYEGKRRPR
ncbi:MAG TPA: type II toxin-antitoxin system RelE/ParE family toxin [Actinomycetota bacterium]|nr:type II toxin-antitoxin system RelE/ParE family toxin [Actinomycetota bacterium]